MENKNKDAPVMLVLQGCPASGKSTWAKEFVQDKPNWVRINRDDIRLMCGKYWTPTREDLISKYEESMINIALAHNYNVIIDATNLNPKTLNKWQRIASNFAAKFETKEFFIPFKEAVKRDKNRDLQVGEDVILGFYRKYYPERLKQELDEL